MSLIDLNAWSTILKDLVDAFACNLRKIHFIFLK